MRGGRQSPPRVRSASRTEIVSDADLRKAALKLAGTIPGTVAHLAIDQPR